jgi:glutaminyl-peptide cyclotransferase
MKKYLFIAFVVLIGIAIISVAVILVYRSTNPQPKKTDLGFNGERAMQDVRYQVSLGPRLPGSEAHRKLVEWLDQELSDSGWDVELQNGTMLEHLIENVIARKGSGNRWIILGAHYDTRLAADRDPDEALRQTPVLGANDGASGVAVLTELARTLTVDPSQKIWLVFFDAEDNGKIAGWDWILGSRYFVEQLSCCPEAVVVVDMVGDVDLNIFREKNSDNEITDQIWAKASALGYSNYFINQPKYAILDDQVPFLQMGIKAIDIIDFDYPYWHTTSDTVDKVSPNSLRIVGETLLSWITQP